MLRRTVLVSAVSGLLAGTFGIARTRAAQEGAQADLASHPIVGSWLAMTPGGAAPSIFGADGSVTISYPPSIEDPARGLVFQGTPIGRWEPVGERGIRFTAAYPNSDPAGTYVGTATIDGHPTVREDGQTFVDESPETRITFRDAANNVVAVVGGDGSFPPVTGVRMGVGAPGFPEGTPAAGTPAA